MRQAQHIIKKSNPCKNLLSAGIKICDFCIGIVLFCIKALMIW